MPFNELRNMKVETQDLSEIRELFGLRLRELRTQKGVSQEKLAELAGVDRTYVSGCERGKRNIGLENLVKLARALKCDAGELLSNQKQ
jgi:transcriptional regulator with XRE-family HTH domain